MDWQNQRVLITGGASFIGSHLAEALLAKGAMVRIADNFSSGKKENIAEHVASGKIELCQGDLTEQAFTRSALQDIDTVFHLAAAHGGRGYVDLHQAACSGNLALDGIVFMAAKEAGVERIVYASSACVYPNFIQNDTTKELYLTEDMGGPPYDADNIYGWAKLMAEMTLAAYSKEYGIKTASCRYFTVYGERGVENHAVIAMIARAFVEQNPFEIWGTGEQLRNWTYVGDIVDGTILTAEKITNGTAINLGTTERTRVMDAAKEVLRYMNVDAEIKTLPEMPTGPYNRIASNTLAKELLAWEPKMTFINGLHRTIDWYTRTRDKEWVRENLERLLTER